jgi:hypothetical protein
MLLKNVYLSFDKKVAVGQAAPLVTRHAMW